MKILKYLIAVILIFLLTETRAQVVYETKWKNEANKKVFITDNPSEANIIVYKTEWKSDASKESGLWFFTEWKTEADLLIYITEIRSEADLIICYTTYKGEAGKRN
ncbi:MAG: DUF6150 family protein [Chitinophagales bacterium]